MGRGRDMPPPLGDLGGGRPRLFFISLVCGVYGMTFEGKVRKLSDKFGIN